MLKVSIVVVKKALSYYLLNLKLLKSKIYQVTHIKTVGVCSMY